MAEQKLFLVDSNVLITHLRNTTAPTIYDRACAAFGVPVVSEIVIFELEVGARRAGRSAEFQTHFPAVRSYPLILPVLLLAAQLHADLSKQNQAIGLTDTFIAATALYHRLPLFTLNTAHFRRVSALTLLQLPEQ